MTDESFAPILAATQRAAKLPKAKQARVFASLALKPEDKADALIAFMWRTFWQKKNGEAMDQLAWVFATAAIGPREVLPWDLRHITFMLRSTAPRPLSLPPAMVARAVEQLAVARGSLSKPMRGWARQAADAIEKALPRDATTKRAVARLRALQNRDR